MDGYTFDHAAQFIVARDAAFAPVLQRWLADGVVQPWEGRFGLLECSDTTMRFVPTGMSHTNSEEPGYAASETPNQSARVALPGRHAR